MKRLKEPVYIWELGQWPRFHWKAELLLKPLSQARIAQGKLIQSAYTLGLDSKRDSQAEILTEETINTAAIEGEKHNREAVRSSVARRLGLPTGGIVPTNRNIEGLVDVLLDATNKYKKPLTIKRVQSWQAALFPTGYSGLHKIRTGAWRGTKPMRVVSGPLGRERIHYEAPPHERLPREMKRFMEWWNKDSNKIDGLLRAGLAHFYFVTIHPFEDGNGRVARALTDMALAQDEQLSQRFYSLSERILADRDSYYSTLERCQKGGPDVTPWLEWFLTCFLRAIRQSERLISKTLWKARFWQKFIETSLNARQRKVLNKLLDAGPDGFEGGLTTRKYTGMTRTSRATAFREMSVLVKEGILLPKSGRGRSAAYDLNWPYTSSI